MNILFFVAPLALAIVYFIFAFNKLVRLRNRAENGWAQIDVQLKRRADLIPNLVNTVKGYMKHERETLEAVIAARTSVIDAKDQGQAQEADGLLTGALRKLFALSESYPDLKASTNFVELQQEIANTENKVAFSRQYYNDSVTRYNTYLQVFPASVAGKIAKFENKMLFEVPETEKTMPEVSF